MSEFWDTDIWGELSSWHSAQPGLNNLRICLADSDVTKCAFLHKSSRFALFFLSPSMPCRWSLACWGLLRSVHNISNLESEDIKSIHTVFTVAYLCCYYISDPDHLIFKICVPLPLISWELSSVYAALGRCKQNIVATINGVFLLLFISWSGYFSPWRGCHRVLKCCKVTKVITTCFLTTVRTYNVN